MQASSPMAIGVGQRAGGCRRIRAITPGSNQVSHYSRCTRTGAFRKSQCMASRWHASLNRNPSDRTALSTCLMLKTPPLLRYDTVCDSSACLVQPAAKYNTFWCHCRFPSAHLVSSRSEHFLGSSEFRGTYLEFRRLADQFGSRERPPWTLRFGGTVDFGRVSHFAPCDSYRSSEQSRWNSHGRCGPGSRALATWPSEGIALHLTRLLSIVLGGRPCWGCSQGTHHLCRDVASVVYQRAHAAGPHGRHWRVSPVCVRRKRTHRERDDDPDVSVHGVARTWASATDLDRGRWRDVCLGCVQHLVRHPRHRSEHLRSHRFCGERGHRQW